MRIALGLVAALLIGVGLVLQQRAAEETPKSYFLHLQLIRALLHKRVWLAGIGVLAVGEILAAWTIGNVDLSVAEPLLATQLIFALIVAVPLAGTRPRKSELLGAVLLASGVAALSVSRSTRGLGEAMRFGSAAYWPAAAVIGALALLCVRAGLHRSGQQRATLTGLAAGLIFGISDALTRSTLRIVDGHGIVAVLHTWPAYSLAVSSLTAVWLMESSFNAAPLHASLPAITAGEPVVGILLGVIVFGDAIRISPGVLALQAAGIVLLVSGVILVARAPALSSLRQELPRRRRASPAETAGDSPGQDDAASERQHDSAASGPQRENAARRKLP